MLPSTRRRRDGSQERRQSQRQGWQREQRDDLTLSEAWHILLERRVLVAGCTILFLAVALLYAFSKEPVYAAEAVLSVRSEEGIAPAGNPDETLSRLRDSTVMDGLSEEAARRAGWEANQSDFNDRLYWEPMNDREVEISFLGRTPQGASGAANAYAEALVERVGELEGRFAGGTVAVDAEVEKVAEPPESRSDRRVFLAVVAAGCGGLLVGGIGALFLEGRARRWSGSRDAELTLRAPVLGVIPDFSNGSLSEDGGAR
jgi:capsular polysaccharide biosynthesis protein